MIVNGALEPGTGHFIYISGLDQNGNFVLGDPAPAIVVCDSKTSRRLADGTYNRRRAECERVVASFRERRGPEAVRWLLGNGRE